MILVSLGTQDKEFPRILKAIDHAIEEGWIQEEVVAQIGQTHYRSTNMKLLDFLKESEFDELLQQARIVITHGGVGTIIHAVNAKKPVIATPRLAKYGEHHNDHQLQIIKRFAEMGCLIPLYEMEDLKDCLKRAETFVPNSYHSNTEAFVARIRDYLKTIE